MTIFYVCAEGATLNNNGNCRNADREWRDIEIPEIPETTALTQEFLLELVTTFSPEVLQHILLALFVGLTTGFSGGLILGIVRKAKNL